VIVFALLCGALFTGVIGTLGAVYVYELDPDQVSPELEWPSWIIYLCIPLGSYLMCFRFLQVMWRFLRTGFVPHQGHGIDYEAPHERGGAGDRGGAMTALLHPGKPAARGHSPPV
jgi:C4-dicarboxylate transporter DctQ subunit